MRPTRFAAALAVALLLAALATGCHHSAQATAISPEPAAAQTLGTPATFTTGLSAGPMQGTELALPTGRRATSLLLIERIAPVDAAVGVPFQYDLRVTNLSDQVLDRVVVHDPLPPTVQLTNAASLGETTRGPEAFRIVALPPLGPTFEAMGYVPPAQQPDVRQPAAPPPSTGPSPLLPYQSQPQRQPSLLSPTAPPVMPMNNPPPPPPAPLPPGLSTTAAPRPLLERRFTLPPPQQPLAYVGPSAGSAPPQQPASRAGEWVVGRLGPGEVRTLRVTATPTAPGPLTSCVTATFQPALCGTMPVRPAAPTPRR